MLVIYIKRPVHKFDLGHLLIQKELQLRKHLLQTPKSQTLNYRRKTVAAGKRTAPAGFIINDPMGKQFHILIYKGNFIQ